MFSVLGCQNGPALEISGMEPDSGWKNTSTPVLIYANNVFPSINISAGDPNAVETDVGLMAALKHRDSVDEWIGINQLFIDDIGNVVGVVGEGMPVGKYDLRLEDDRGREDLLENAFEVTFSEVSRFEVTADSISAISGERITVTNSAIKAGSLDDEIYDGPVKVRVWMEPLGTNDVSAFSETELTIVNPGGNWSDVRESATKPVLEGVMVESHSFELVANWSVFHHQNIL